MSYNRPSDWDSTGAHNYIKMERGQRYRGANGQLYAHDGWPIDESAPRIDRYPLEWNWDSRGWDASGRNASIRMEPGRTYRVGGQTYAHDGWPISNESENAAPASTRRPQPRAPESHRRRSPSPDDRDVKPRQPADERWVPPGAGFPPRPRYYDDDPDDYSHPAPSSRYPYQDDYNRDSSYRGNLHDQDYPARRRSTADDYGTRSPAYRNDYDDGDYRGSYGRGDYDDRDYPNEPLDDGRGHDSSHRDARHLDDEYQDYGSRGYRTLSIYRVRGF